MSGRGGAAGLMLAGMLAIVGAIAAIVNWLGPGWFLN